MKKITKMLTALMMAFVCVFGLVACGGDPESPEEPVNPTTPTSTASKWDGTIPGWQAPNLSKEEIIANRPSTYVVDNDENPTTVTLKDANAFVWFAYRSVLGENGFEGITVKLDCDIDLDNHMWIPIGLGGRSNAPKTAFQGTFDGQNHTIYNLNSGEFMNKIKYGTYTDSKTETETTGYYLQYENQSATGKVTANITVDVKTNDDEDALDEVTYGLFGTVKDATIKNVKIENVQIDLTAKEYGRVATVKDNEVNTKLIGDSVGALVGFARGTTTIENCTVGKAAGKHGFIKGGTNQAGIVGRVYAGTDHTEVSNRPGQLGKNQPFGTISIKNCTNNLDVEGSLIKSDKNAGIIAYGQFFTTMTIENCTNNGNITGTGYTAGIMGYRASVDKNNASYGYTDDVLTSYTSYINCVNNGKIVGNVLSHKNAVEGHVGGILAYRSVSTASKESTFVFRDCKNHGELVLNSEYTKTYNVGGLVGYMSIVGAQGTFEDCTNTGKITINAKTALKVNVGGLVGNLTLKTSKSSISVAGGSLQVTGCVNSGNIVAIDHTNIECETEITSMCVGTVIGEDADIAVVVAGIVEVNEKPALTNTGSLITTAA